MTIMSSVFSAHLQYKVSDKLTTMSAVRWTRLLFYWLHPITPVVGALRGDTDNICDNLSPYFYRAVVPQCRLSVRL